MGMLGRSHDSTALEMGESTATRRISTGVDDRVDAHGRGHDLGDVDERLDVS